MILDKEKEKKKKNDKLSKLMLLFVNNKSFPSHIIEALDKDSNDEGGKKKKKTTRDDDDDEDDESDDGITK